MRGSNCSRCLLLILLQPSHYSRWLTHPFWSRKCTLSESSLVRSLCCQISGNYITKEAEGRIIALCNCSWITIKAAPHLILLPHTLPPSFTPWVSIRKAKNRDHSHSISFTPRLRITDRQLAMYWRDSDPGGDPKKQVKRSFLNHGMLKSKYVFDTFYFVFLIPMYGSCITTTPVKYIFSLYFGIQLSICGYLTIKIPL